jgi:hypothetical protein
MKVVVVKVLCEDEIASACKFYLKEKVEEAESGVWFIGASIRKATKEEERGKQ